MINWMYFPQNKKIEDHLMEVINVFITNENSIDSYHNTLSSDEVLSCVRNGLIGIGYSVEKSKKKEDKIRVPVLYGENGKVNLAFEVDAFSDKNNTVIEVEAGRAVVNYQFLKDFYEACMMQGVKYFCVAVRNQYRDSKDFVKVCNFFRTLYLSNAMKTPLEGVLVIGY